MRSFTILLILKTLLLELVMFDELVGAAVVSVPLVEDVLAYLVERLTNIRIVSEQLVDDRRIDLSVFVIYLQFVYKMEILR